jgi:hypothetical protein
MKKKGRLFGICWRRFLLSIRKEIGKLLKLLIIGSLSMNKRLQTALLKKEFLEAVEMILVGTNMLGSLWYSLRSSLGIAMKTDENERKMP